MSGNIGCWVLADGLGGHQGGATASRLAVDAVLAAFREKPAVSPDAAGAYVRRANQALIERQQTEPELRSMRTTIVVLLASPDAAAWAHIGDSRLYRFSGKTWERTKDHSVPQRLADAGEIPEDRIRFHEDRNLLLKSLGSRAGVGVDVAASDRAPRAGDAFLLASDGFWEWLTEAEMLEDLRSSSSCREWLAKMEARVQGRATRGHDNYTAIGAMVRRTLSWT